MNKLKILIIVIITIGLFKILFKMLLKIVRFILDNLELMIETPINL